ncbi:MAG: hypothetical protein HYY31_07080 [Chloroflexi bacterium]|nr:hypothetical protein [Chloroflexota bacterium]
MGKRLRIRGIIGTRGFLGLLLLSMVFLGAGSYALSPEERLASPYLFSLVKWETQNFPAKWLHRLKEFFSSRGTSQEERRALIEEYFRLQAEAQAIQQEGNEQGVETEEHSSARLGASQGDEATEAPGRAARLRELKARRERIRGAVEEAIEATLGAVFREQDLVFHLGPWRLPFPPVDLRFQSPPKVLVLSPRERIHLQESILLRTDLTVKEMEELEDEAFRRQGFSALVEQLGGVSTFPAIVGEGDSLRETLRAAAHEWLHHYLYFRPLGKGYGTSSEMSTLNETLADIAGRELGDFAYERLGGQKASSPVPEVENEEGFSLKREMRQTRLRVETLLTEGRIGEAEQYMEERRLEFAQHDVRIRKLNQAYFAFHGTYAESPASISPAATELKQLRNITPSIGVLVQIVSRFPSYVAFEKYLGRLPGLGP